MPKQARCEVLIRCWTSGSAAIVPCGGQSGGSSGEFPVTISSAKTIVRKLITRILALPPRRIAGTEMIRVGVLFLLMLVLPARAEPVDLQLILAVDASESVSSERFELQMHGYAAAFRDPAVLDAIGKGARGRVAIAMVQWTGPKKQVPVFDWMEVHDAASAAALAAAIDAARRATLNSGAAPRSAARCSTRSNGSTGRLCRVPAG